MRKQTKARSDCELGPVGKLGLKISEADLERAGTELLQWDGWRSLKTDPVSRREWGKGFGEKGMADHLYIRYRRPIITGYSLALLCMSQVLWIEWKRRGGKAKAHQLEWARIERERGAIVLLADVDFEATYDDFYRLYRRSGLMEKDIQLK